MPTARTRLARRIIPFVLVVLAIVLITFSMRAQAQVESAQSQSSDRSVAVQEFAQRTTQPVRDLIGWFGDVRTARQERDQLAQENAVLRSDLAYSTTFAPRLSRRSRTISRARHASLLARHR